MKLMDLFTFKLGSSEVESRRGRFRVKKALLIRTCLGDDLLYFVGVDLLFRARRVTLPEFASERVGVGVEVPEVVDSFVQSDLSGDRPSRFGPGDWPFEVGAVRLQVFVRFLFIPKDTMLNGAKKLMKS